MLGNKPNSSESSSLSCQTLAFSCKSCLRAFFLFVRVFHANRKFSESPFAAGAFVRIHLLFVPIWGSRYNYSPHNADIVTEKEKEKELTHVYLASNSLGELEFERGQSLGL